MIKKSLWLKQIIIVMLLAAVVCACGDKQADITEDDTPSLPSLPSFIEEPQGTPEAVPTTHIEPLSPELMPQFLPIEAGEEIAVITTSKGEIRMRFFPEFAPLAVENFITLAREGYYNDILFHRVVDRFIVQTGDPTGTGFGGSSMYGEGFETEITTYLHFFRGAVGMARDEDFDSNGSQFFIVQNNKLDEYYIEVLEDFRNNQELEVEGTDAVRKDFYPLEAIDRYISEGGRPDFDLKFTVFGHVYEGMEVVDAIAAAETDTDERPLEDIKLIGIEILLYE